MPERNDDLNAMINRLWPILVRRRWWILSTFLTVSLITTIVALVMPAKYRSEATILVQSQHAPNELVISNSTSNTMEDLDAMTDQILSRTHLLAVIDEFHLYPTLRDKLVPNELATLMRNNIEVTPLNKNPERRTANAFAIAFTASNPETAQQVANRLTSLFIEENQEAIQGKDTGMTSFLSSQLDAAKQDLAKQEALVSEFKMRNLGQLPEQEQGNIEILSGLQSQLQANQANLAQARQQKVYLTAMLSQPTAPASATTSQEPAPPSPITALQTDLAQLRSQRQDLLSRYSPLYPDVVSLNQRIADEEAQLKSLIASAPPVNKTPRPASADSTNPAVAQLKSQLEANRQEIADDERRVNDLQGQIQGYQGRLNQAPVRAQQLSEVMRNYDQAKQRVADLQTKQSESELATNLAKKQIDAQFQIIDGASFPAKPSTHQRIAIGLGGFLGGIVLGIVIALVAEARTQAFHTEKELKKIFAVPLIVSVPPFRTPDEETRLASRHRMEWIFGIVATVLLAAIQVFIIQRG